MTAPIRDGAVHTHGQTVLPKISLTPHAKKPQPFATNFNAWATAPIGNNNLKTNDLLLLQPLKECGAAPEPRAEQSDSSTASDGDIFVATGVGGSGSVTNGWERCIHLRYLVSKLLV